jgi:hypothetical protein
MSGYLKKDSFREMIAVDFDGVLHSYSSGWKGNDVIPDAPVPGAIRWLIDMCLISPYNVGIYSARTNAVNAVDGERAIRRWIRRETYDWMTTLAMYAGDDNYELLCADHATVMGCITIIREKPPEAFIFIDDRAWKFQGTFPSLLELEHFKPWYK